MKFFGLVMSIGVKVEEGLVLRLSER